MESYIPGARGCLVLDLLKGSSCSREFSLKQLLVRVRPYVSPNHLETVVIVTEAI